MCESVEVRGDSKERHMSRDTRPREVSVGGIV